MGNVNDLPLLNPRMQYPNNPYGRLYARVRSKISDFRPVFESLPLDERFSFLYNYALTNDLFCEVQIESTKSSAKALEQKCLGNKAFQQNRYMDALKSYTQSVAFASPNTKELAVAFANRSAALFRLKRYEACLVDINRALKIDDPDLTEEWKQKLVDRKRQCMVKVEEYCAAEMNHLVCVSSSVIDDDTMEEWIARRKKECEIDENAMDVNYDERFYVPSGNLTNPLVRDASEKFTIRYSPEKGRHMVATEDIKAGELLHIEKPYAAILRFGLYYRNCSYCFVRCEALTPCPTCSKVMYCSVRCRNEAYDRYHRMECAILPIAMEFGEEEPAWLALRMLFMATKQGDELDAILNHPAYQEPLKNIDSSVLENFDSDFMHIYNLMLNFHRPEGQWHPSCINAVTYLYMLKHTEFFAVTTGQNINHDTLTDTEAQVGNLLFRLILIVQSNAKLLWESYEKEVLYPGDSDYQMLNIAFGIYPFASFYNHSCDQNVVIAYHKNTVVCHACQPIYAGQELCIDYGMFHHESPLLERLQGLQKEWFFTCDCEACVNNWPTMDKLNALSQHYQLVDDIDFDSVNVEEYYKKKFAFYDWRTKRQEKNAHSAKLLELVADFTSVFGKFIQKPCYDYFQCQNEIRTIFYDRANYYTLSRDKVLVNL